MIGGSGGIAEAVNYIEIANYFDDFIIKAKSKFLEAIILPSADIK